jgi:hypothetical protein
MLGLSSLVGAPPFLKIKALGLGPIELRFEAFLDKEDGLDYLRN